ncbi:MAG: transcription-repair coupling factor, partial [Muribaculaceae bacterium]|nr:transcription-repair coupling factor [Muribaculaceae bacterium]
LMVPPGKPLTPVAQRRLHAIESFSDLGSGIHIAMQDLDIRGAGNLLGAEQSGFIADLGYETYQKILKEAVTELRAEEFADLPAAQNDVTQSDDFAADCVVETDMELLLPATYVPQASERIALYQELDSLDREDAVKAFAERLRDRFGTIPHETENLLLVPRLRRLARQIGIEKVNLKGGVMYIYFVDQSNEAYYKSPMFGRVLTYLSLHPRRVKIRTESVKNSFSILNVKDINTAVDILSEILGLPPS